MTDPARTQPVWISEPTILPAVERAAAIGHHRRVEQFSGQVAATAAAGLAETFAVEPSATDKLEDARASVAHYADLNHVLGEALARATDTAKCAVAERDEMRDELDELRRDTQEVWERAVRADEFERKYHAAQAELNSTRGIVAAARGIR